MKLKEVLGLLRKDYRRYVPLVHGKTSFLFKPVSYTHLTLPTIA